jgi:ATP-dependent RNA helicase DeaD
MFLRNELLKVLREMNWESPSPVQLQAMPEILNGRDSIVQSPAGTGKTGVFLVGILNQIRVMPKK